MILWFPFFIFSIICGGLANILSRVPFIFAPLVFGIYKCSNFILNLIIKDLVHSATGTPLEKYLKLIKKEEL
jgi:hypothetical protein